MTFDDFVQLLNGKPVESEDPTNLNQCFDLAFAWVDNLNIPRDSIRHLRAYQIFTEATDKTRQCFDLIANTKDNVPQKGDLVIWGTGIGISGHVAVFQMGDSKSFYSFDQNWDGVQYCRIVKHNYNAVIGWLHPKASNTPQPQSSDNSYQEYKDRIQTLDNQVETLQQNLLLSNSKYTDLKTEYEAYKAQNTTLAGLTILEAFKLWLSKNRNNGGS